MTDHLPSALIAVPPIRQSSLSTTVLANERIYKRHCRLSTIFMVMAFSLLAPLFVMVDMWTSVASPKPVMTHSASSTSAIHEACSFKQENRAAFPP